MSENTMLYALYRMGYHSRATGHGFRSTASTILNEHGFPPDVAVRQRAPSVPIDSARLRSVALAGGVDMDLADKRVLVTGGAGFLGRHLVAQLQAAGCGHVIVPRSREVDLRREAAVHALFARERPQVVIHLAAVVGGHF